jgi:hypothetical protein
MDADKIQQFFLEHFEKMILVVVLGAAGFLVYSGTKYENILETHQPDRLIADAKQVRAAVDDDHNDQILPDRRPDFDIKKEIDRVRSELKPEHYAFDHLAPKDKTSSVRRRDPVLQAPKAVQMHGVLASMAIRSPQGEYAVKDLEPADPIEVEVEVVREPRERRGRGRGASGEDGMEEMMEMFEMEDEMEMEMDMDMGMGGPSMGGAGATRRLSDALGMRPSSTRHFLSDTEQPPVPGMGWFIAGTAVVPFKSLHESYKSAFADADGYDPMRRDRPIFKGYEVQRADVTTKSVDQLQDADWVTRDGRKETIRDAIVLWSGFSPEIVPVDYREDETLTMWIPPVMLEDYSTFSLHPLIPMISMKEREQQEAMSAQGNVPQEIKEGDIIIGEAGSRSNNQYGDGMEMAGEEMDDMEGGLFGGYGGNPAAMKNPPEYKLIRFYDFALDPNDPNAPKPNHQYVYRVRVVMEDPNFPQDPLLQPKFNTLAEDTYVRVMAKVASVEKDADPVKRRSAESVITSQWSEPSDPVALPGLEKIYAGPVTERKVQPFRVGNRTVLVDAEPPKANVVVSQFKAAYGTRLPMFIESITEGAVLSKTAEFGDIVDPITLEVKKLPDAKVISGATIIDLDGGLPLSIQEGEGLVEPGLMLLFDEDGGLAVHEEVDDQELYRSASFAEQRGK